MTTLYAHNQQNLVRVGQQANKGETIAPMGSTGNSTGAHLHFEVSASPSLSQAKLVDQSLFNKIRIAEKSIVDTFLSFPAIFGSNDFNFFFMKTEKCLKNVHRFFIIFT